jgi:hypothetical protein
MSLEPRRTYSSARYLTHTGERPIAITWELDHPMPAEVFNAATVAAG